MNFRLLIVGVLCLLTACKKGNDEAAQAAADGRTYFSIAEYAKDQWQNLKGEPWGIKKTVYFDGVVDSSVSNVIEMDWSPVFKTFFETDISKEKFRDKYDFSAFEEKMTSTKNFVYEAKDPKLYTRKLMITADVFSDQITTIYIEAQKNDRMGTRDLKLFYSRLDKITISEVETSSTGKRKEMRVEYQFL